jgi:hypothetical protein
MATICWTILHHATAPVVHVTHTVRHSLGPVVHRASRLLHHAPRVAAKSPTWVELVCKTVPGALVGGGLLVPIPATAPHVPPPPAIVDSAPTTPWLPFNWVWPPDALSSADYDSTTPIVKTPEPSSVVLLLGGIGGLLLIRLVGGSFRRDGSILSGSDQPGASATDLPG